MAGVRVVIRRVIPRWGVKVPSSSAMAAVTAVVIAAVTMPIIN